MMVQDAHIFKFIGVNLSFILVIKIRLVVKTRQDYKFVMDDMQRVSINHCDAAAALRRNVELFLRDVRRILDADDRST